MTFRDWLILSEGRTGDKTGLYPLGYAGIGLYPPQTYLPGSADGLYYLSQDERIYKGIEGPPHDIRHIPGKPSSLKSVVGEGPPHRINHIPGKSPKPTTGEGEPFKINHIKK
jgi:hypothetical protein